MKKSLFLFLTLFLTASLMARPMDKAEALTVAKKYFSSSNSQMMRVKANQSYELTYVGSDKKVPDNTDGTQNYFYVYNIGNNNGFVIVAADTRTKSVLGYSRSGSFDASRIPDNLKSWLTVYTEEIKYAVENLPDIETFSTVKPMKRASAQTTAVQPLLGSIVYNQGAPYNDSCPAVTTTDNTTNPPTTTTERTVTGCVATAIAQVMRYHKWPVTGTGSKTYTSTTRKFNLTANFGATNYDWANMPQYYNSSSTNIQKAAVAKLMLHVGISVSMNYDLSSAGGSGANTSRGASALYDYFGYDAGIQFYLKDYFPENEWINKLKTELNAGRPVVYSGGNTSGAGHAFVCDGYDDNNMFHFNWGWSGSSNGYYAISALNPQNQGIGSSNGGYNLRQGMMTGIQKPINGSVHRTFMGVDSIIPSANSIPRDGTVTLTLKKLMNTDGFTLLGKDIAIACVLQGQNTTDTVFIDDAWGNLSGNSYYSSIPYENTSFSAGIANGNYKLKFLYKNESKNFVPLLVTNGGVGFLDVEITSTKINFTVPNRSPVLNLTASPATLSNLYQNKKGQFELTISNTGVSEYNSQIGLKLTKTDDPTVTQEVITSLTRIIVGETKTIQLSGNVTVAPGNYTVSIFYNAANQSTVSTFPTTLLSTADHIPTVTVNATPTDAPVLSLVGSANMPTTVTLGQDFAITANVQNTGGVFDNRVIAFIFKSGVSTSVAFLGNQYQVLDNNTSKLITFNGNVANLTPGSYYAKLYYMATNWTAISPNKYNFTVAEPVDTPVFDAKIEGFKVLGNPIMNELKVTLPENATLLTLYTVQGKQVKSITVSGETTKTIPVSDLQAGIYILKLQTKDKTASVKVVKK